MDHKFKYIFNDLCKPDVIKSFEEKIIMYFEIISKHN